MEKGVKRNPKGGYTLVEVITVLAIIAIVAGAAVYGILAYQRYAAFRKNNEYAKTIFTAAQSALTHYKASGELEELNALLGEDNEVPADVAPEHTGRLYHLIIQGGDMASEEGSLLYELLDDYILDESVWDASICLEFDPGDGVVYSVSYSDKADSFSYTSSPGSFSDGVMSITDRTYSVRKKICLGYYDASLSDKSPSSYGKTSISKVELVNGESLDLKWWMGTKYKSITNKLNYSIRLYDSNNNLCLSFSINGQDLLQNSNNNITVDVKQYISSGAAQTTETLKNCVFRAYRTKNNVMYLTLDGLDIQAQPSGSGTVEPDKLKDTFSALRLGLDASQKYYVKVQASGSNYKASGWVGSASESVLFGGRNSSNEYIIQNIRHLYNIRFLETSNDEGEGNTHYYVQEGRADWAGKDGIIAHGNAFDGGKTIKYTEKSKYDFPTIKQLNQDSTYSAKKAEDTKYAVANMRITGKDGKPAGLFCTNKGTVKNVTFEDIEVDGRKSSSAGILCGKNEGTLQNITTKGGSVYGESNVGGIAGMDVQNDEASKKSGNAAERKISYSGLKNDSDVYGSGNNIGGIIGSLEGKKGKTAEITKCSNTGAVYAKAETGSSNDLGGENGKSNENIGGIVGKAVYTEIKSCTGSAQYTEEEVESISSTLYGTNVGGIAGLAENSKIEDCSTEGGYVIGKSNVGGIVGIVTNAGGTWSLDGNGQQNAAYVVGNEKVGGIIGNVGENCEISNWSNTGIVTAKEQFGGGITGYNEGTIINCISNVDISSVSGDTLLEVAKARGDNGDSIGGLAGYNNGTIKIESSQNVFAENNVVSVVAGKNYVGGIIGYNDTEGTLEGYALGGGYLSGSRFVGGICGINLSSNLFESELSASPNKIEGDYYVGGIAGGNLIALDIKSGSVEKNIKCNVNNFLGTIEANGAFAGGYFGYNHSFYQGAAKEHITETIEELAGIDESTIMDIANWSDPSEKVNMFTLVINEEYQAGTVLGSITAPLYVGGVIGQNTNDTQLKIMNVTNQTPVSATAFVQNDEYGEGKAYSYAGGIIGYVGENVVIDNCSNSGRGEVLTQGTYTGGLAEVNKGRIIRCSTNSLSAGSDSYVGGIVGVNGSTNKKNYNDFATIEDCEVKGTITGHNYVGGIAAENYEGIITGITVNGTVRGSGNYVGGVAGHHAYSANSQISNVMLNGTVTGSGTNVGGIIGWNEGRISDLRMNDKNVTVMGNGNVGGFIGLMSSGSLENLINTASVTAQVGNAGGIAGSMEKNTKGSITLCENRGRVTADKSGNAGGIIAVNNATISQCTNTGAIVSNNGTLGGIAAINSGSIKGSDVKLPSNETALVFTGRSNIGGIAGENTGKITNEVVWKDGKQKMIPCRVSGVTIRNQSSGAGNIGGVAGLNNTENGKSGTIQNTIVDDITVSAIAEGTNAGGVAGVNAGSIGNSAGSSMNINAAVNFGGSAASTITGNLGGVAGVNEEKKTIENISFTGSIKGTFGASRGYGGITGINKGRISGCDVSAKTSEDYLAYAAGSDNDIPNIGGITGRNEQSGGIENSKIIRGKLRTDGQGYLGGIAGYNAGTIRKCNNQETGTVSEAKVAISASKGQVGGIAGYNDQNGLLSECTTGSNWEISQEKKVVDAAIGGIIGFNISGHEMSGLVNYAEVTQSGNDSDSVGGIMGRQEAQVSSVWMLKDCLNYGTVRGQNRVGGMIGQWKYSSGMLENCRNYGKVIAKGGDGTGGLVGRLYTITGGSELYFNECYNSGYIEAASNAGGLLGGAASITADSFHVYFNDCVNAGDLKGSGGGMAGNPGRGKYIFSRCRNYGKSVNNSEMSGIIASAPSNIIMTDCFGIDTVKYPLTNADTDSSSSGNYYISTDEDMNIENYKGILYSQFKIPEQSGKDTYSNAAALVDGDKIKNGRWEYDWKKDKKENGTALWSGSKDIEIDFLDTQQLNTLSIYWYPQETKIRTYVYELFYINEQGEEQRIEPDSVTGTSRVGSEKVQTGTIDIGGVTYYTAQYQNYSVSAADPAEPVTYTLESPADAKGFLIRIKKVTNTTPGRNDETAVQYASIYEVEFNNKTNEPVSTAGNTGKGRGSALWNGKKEGGTYFATELNSISYPAYIDNLSHDPLEYKTLSSLETCKDVDSGILQYYGERYGKEKLETPDELNLVEKDGAFTLTWKENVKAHYMNVKVNIYDNQKDSEPSASKSIIVRKGNTASFTLDDEWQGKYMNISVQAVSYNADNSSEFGWLYETPQPVPDVLPTPQVYLKLVEKTGENADLIYQIVIENQEDYLKYPEAVVTVNLNYVAGTAQGSSTTVKVFPEDDQAVVIKGEEAGSHDVIDMTIQASASKNGTTVTSRKVSYQTEAYPDSSLKGKTITSVVTGTSGFLGATIDDLEYRQALRTIAGTSYTRTEILTYDDEIGVDVVMNSIETALTKGSVEAANAVLTNLDSEVRKNIIDSDAKQVTVRSYPWRSKNYLVHYGEVIKQDLTAEEVGQYITVDEDGTRSVKPGYVIELTDTGRYQVLETQLLSDEDYRLAQVTSNVLEKLSVTKIPVIGVYKKSGATYTFEWDQNDNHAADFSYNVTLTGYKKETDGTEEKVQLANEAAYNSRSLIVDGAGWRYNRLELKVTRIGTSDNNGMTDILGLSATRSFDITLPLETITIPSCEILDKDNLNYKVSWTGIQDETELKELKGYTVYGRVDGAEPVKLGSTHTETSNVIPTSMNVDLDDYEGKTIQIYVVANVREDAVYYTDSEEGVYREIEVPKRLAQPDMEKLIFSDAYKSGSYVTMEKFTEAGMNVTLQMDDLAGTYVIRAGIYDSSEADSAGRPTGRLLQQLTDEEGEVMAVKNGIPVYPIVLNSKEYAARYLFVSLKTTDSSQISSKWTAYREYQLPRVRLDSMDLEEGTVENSWQLNETENLKLMNNTITWTEKESDSEKAGYNLSFKTADIDGIQTARDTAYDVKLRKSKDSEGNPAFEMETPNLDKVKESDPDTQIIRLAEDEEYDSETERLYTAEWKGYGWNIDAKYNDTGNEFKVTVYLEIQVLVSKYTGDMTYRFILPDTVSSDEAEGDISYAYTKNLLTKEIFMQAVPSEEERYHISKTMKWYRTHNQQNEDIIKVEEQDD